MGTRKKTLYEILGVAPTATVADIRRAHQQLSRKLLLEGGSREELNFKLQVLDVALHTLASPVSRDEYDAQIAPPMLPVPVPIPTATHERDAQALRVAAVLAESQRIAADMRATQILPLKTTVDGTLKSLAKIMRLFIGLLILAVVAKWGTNALAVRAPANRIDPILLQEERVSNDPAEVERRRQENAEKAAALEQKKRADAEKKFVEESRRMGKKVTENLNREEARARDEAARQAWLAAQEKRQREAAQQRQEEAEKRRIAEERRKLGLPY